MVDSVFNEHKPHSVSVRCTLDYRLYYLARMHSLSLDDALAKGLQLNLPPPQKSSKNYSEQRSLSTLLTMDSAEYPLGLRHSFY